MPFTGSRNLLKAKENVNARLNAPYIMVQPALTRFTPHHPVAGDMPAQFADEKLTLLQTWSQDDFRRVQENPLIGHWSRKSGSSFLHAFC